LKKSMAAMMRSLSFLFGCDADVTQDGGGELGEEALDEVEPGAMRGRKGEFEAICGLLRDPGSGLGMIVVDQLDRRVGRIGGIEELEEFDEFATPVTSLTRA
jgi:hypothetical protein